MQLKPLLRRWGWRRIWFVMFCVAMIAAGGHSTCGVNPTGGPITVSPGWCRFAMGMFALLALATPWLVGRDALPPLSGTRPKALPPGDKAGLWAGAALAMVAAGAIWGQRMEMSLWTDEVTSVRENIVRALEAPQRQPGQPEAPVVR